MADAPWFLSLWRSLDGTLRSLSRGARKALRMLRLVRALLIIGLLTILASAVVGIFWPQYFFYVYAGAVLFLAVPLVIMLALVILPLRAKSIVRLVDMGYPDNAKELAIRMAARKIHEESIESEELLFATAWNESKKMYRRYRERAQQVRQQRDEPHPPR